MAGILTRGLALIEYALLDEDGVPGTVWDTFGLTDADSAVTLIEAEPSKTYFRAHEKKAPLDVDIVEGELPLLFSLINPTLEALQVLFEAVIEGTGANAALIYPSSRNGITVAIRVIPKKGNMHQFNRVHLWPRPNYNWETTSKLVVDIAGEVLVPENGAVDFRKEGPQATTIRGGVATATIVDAGEDYTVGTVTGVPLVNAAGEYAQATLVVAAGAVTTITITRAGKNYHKGSVVTAPSLPGGSGFKATIATIV